MTSNHVVVDGSNIATEGRSLPSLRQLDEAVRAFLSERPHELCTVVVDATFEHRIDTTERQLYDDALAANEILTPPAGSIGRGDKFILEIADRSGATVFSNDSFQEFHGDYEWLFEEGRLVGGKPVPGVGWVFVERTPVRGPKSRMATRAASKKAKRSASGASAKRAARSGPASSGVELGQMPVPTTPPPGRRTKKAVATSPPAKAPKAPKAKAPAARAKEPANAVPAPAAGGDGRRRRGGMSLEPQNAPLPFIEFVAEHQPGATVTGEVTEFSSHGATVVVGDVRCYAPLRFLADPPPRAAREVLERGASREFVVVAIHAARRGIDLGLPEVVSTAVATEATAPRPGRSRRPAATTVTEEPAAAGPAADQAPGDPGAEQPESEVTLAPTKKAPARRAPAKKAPARKTTAKKAPARKAPARKAPARKAPARKTTAKKAPARKTTAKKAPARKATARKAPARKTTAKKAPARKATAKKAPARKAPARKTTAKKAPAKKAPARKTTAKKAPARKTTARKAPARKAPAKRATATRTR
jgi:hypothetical protein